MRSNAKISRAPIRPVPSRCAQDGRLSVNMYLEGPRQFGLHVRIAGRGRRRPTDDQHRLRWVNPGTDPSEDFADQPLDPIAYNRTPDPFAHCNAQARPTSRRRLGDHHKQGPRPSSWGALKPQELPALPDPRRARQARAAALRYRGCFGGIVTVSRLRPLARRRFSTCRPPGVAMRARKPCVRLRRLLLGWYVRFMRSSHTGRAVRGVGSSGQSRLRLAAQRSIETKTGGRCQRHRSHRRQQQLTT